MNYINSKNKGFTLIELLIVIGIISILAGIVLVAVNPAVQFGKANDTQRKSDISTILKAVYEFEASPTSRGALPICMLGATPTATPIPECDGAGTGSYDGAYQLGSPSTATIYDCSTVLAPFYLRSMPVDPTSSTYNATATGYYICQHTTSGVKKVYVIAKGTEVFTTDGGCQIPGTTTATMCISG
jgi:type IV pilus assembly protein PilA